MFKLYILKLQNIRYRIYLFKFEISHRQYILHGYLMAPTYIWAIWRYHKMRKKTLWHIVYFW